MELRSQLVLFLCLFLLFVVGETASSKFNVRYHLATKTMYWNQNEGNTTPPATCSPVQTNFMARHGARYPGKSDIEAFSTLQNTMHQYSSYYTPEYQWMATWENPYSVQEANILTYSGQVEHYNLASRMISRYPDLMTQKYEYYVYEFQSTTKSRTGVSGMSFGYNMFQSAGHIPPVHGEFRPFFMYSESNNEDLTLRFFDNCPEYSTSVENNQSAIIQADLYQTNVAEQALALSKLIGVYPHWNISVDEMQLMYTGCGFDIARANITRHFCTLFNPENTAVLEYQNDLLDYYQKGYGYPINYQIACGLWKEFLEIHQEYANGTNTDLLGKFRFAHAETLMPLVSLLGLFKDSTPLMADWTAEQIAERKWKSSYISPFAGNVQTVLYQCDSEFMVKFLLNEKEYVLPGCSSVYCPLDQLLSAYSDALQCPFFEMCYPGSSPCEYHCGF